MLMTFYEITIRFIHKEIPQIEQLLDDALEIQKVPTCNLLGFNSAQNKAALSA